MWYRQGRGDEFDCQFAIYGKGRVGGGGLQPPMAQLLLPVLAVPNRMGEGGGGGGGSGFHTERQVMRRNGRGKEWWTKPEDSAYVPLTSRRDAPERSVYALSFQDQLKGRYNFQHEAVPRYGQNTAFKTSEDLEKAIKPTCEQRSHFRGDTDRYVTSYGYDSRYINAQAQVRSILAAEAKFWIITTFTRRAGMSTKTAPRTTVFSSLGSKSGRTE